MRTLPHPLSDFSNPTVHCSPFACCPLMFSDFQLPESWLMIPEGSYDLLRLFPPGLLDYCSSFGLGWNYSSGKQISTEWVATASGGGWN